MLEKAVLVLLLFVELAILFGVLIPTLISLGKDLKRMSK